MIRCREVTRLVSLSMDTSLPAGRRILVRLHLLVCRGCARYERQLRLIRDLLRRPEAAPPLSGGEGGETLSEGARERIRKSLRSA